MEVKIIFSLGDSDTPVLKELIAVLAKGQLTQEEPAMPFEVVEDNSKKVAKTEKAEPVVTEKVEEPEKAEPKVEAKTESVKVNDVTLDDIRSIARKLADDGRQNEYKPILKKYGYAKVNLIQEEHFAAIHSEMAALIGEDNA